MQVSRQRFGTHIVSGLTVLHAPVSAASNKKATQLSGEIIQERHERYGRPAEFIGRIWFIG
jgi:hypothetical protein